MAENEKQNAPITKTEAADMLECVSDLMKAFPRAKTAHYLGHWNDLCLFLERVKAQAKDG